MNSLAKLHDFVQIGLDRMNGPEAYDSWAGFIFNVPAMAPAALINYAALLDGNTALYQRNR